MEQSMDGIESAWQEILDSSERATIFQTPEWVSRYGDNDTKWFFQNEDGIAPLELKVRNSTRTVRLIGGDYEDFIVRQGRGQEFLSAVIRHLLQQPGWDICDFRSLAEDSAVLAGLGEANSSGKYPSLGEFQSKITVDVMKHDEYTRVILPKTWKEYEGHLGYKLAKQLRAEPKRRLKNFDVDGLSMANEETFDHDFNEMVALHTKRWVGKGENGIFEDPKHATALKNFSRQMLKKGQLWLYNVRFAEAPGGALLAFHDTKRVYFYICGYDDEFKKYRPVKVLIAQGIQDAMALGLKEYSFLRGQEPYKLEWGNDQQLISRVVIARKTLRGQVGAKAFVVQAKFKAMKQARQQNELPESSE